MKTLVHVNQHVIKSNSKNNEFNPVLTVKNYKSNNYGHEVLYNGEVVGKFVYSPDHPLSCGAKVWFETKVLEVEVVTYET